MEIKKFRNSRGFLVGSETNILITHVADVCLEPNEQLTFQHPLGGEYDFVCKEWGYYASPSLNHRLRNEGFGSFLVRNEEGRLYLMVVSDRARDEFDEYCKKENQEIIFDLGAQ